MLTTGPAHYNRLSCHRRRPRPYHYAPADVRQLVADGAPPETILFHLTPAEVEHVFLDLATAYEQARVKAGYDQGRMPTLAELVAGVVWARVVVPE